MNTAQRLINYRAALERWARAKRNNDFTVHRPTRAEYQLDTSDVSWAAEQIERDVARKHRIAE